MSASERQTLGANVRAARKRKGWSQEELADHCGLHRTYVGGIERGERNVTLENILRLAGALNVVPAELLKGVPSLAPKRAEFHKR
jgi:transcriptional regulator with XRE-family HTH domain